MLPTEWHFDETILDNAGRRMRATPSRTLHGASQAERTVVRVFNVAKTVRNSCRISTFGARRCADLARLRLPRAARPGLHHSESKLGILRLICAGKFTFGRLVFRAF
jgi:hypothetical protein